MTGQTAQIGDLAPPRTFKAYPGYEFVRRVARTAYARNGTGSKVGTPTYDWIVRHNGQRVGMDTTLRGAKALAAEHQKEPT